MGRLIGRGTEWSGGRMDNDFVFGRIYLMEEGFLQVSAPSSGLGLSYLECLSLRIVLLLPLQVPLPYFNQSSQ